MECNAIQFTQTKETSYNDCGVHTDTFAAATVYRDKVNIAFVVEAMRRDVRGLATMHIVTDLSLWAPAEASIDALRSHAHSHEAALRRALHHQGVHPFAFTVADFLHAWPSLQWPAPGEPLFPMSAYDGPTRSWLLFLERTLRRRGLWAGRMRRVPDPASGMNT